MHHPPRRADPREMGGRRSAEHRLRDRLVPVALSPLGLLKTPRLWALTLTQSCGALNDNLVKNALVVLALFQLGIGGTGLSALAGALFIAPYILLSATAGKLADRFAKPRLILIYK